MSALRVGLGSNMIEPGLTGGRLDGIGVYTDAMLRYLPGAGCDVTAYAWPSLRGGTPGDISVGQPMPQSFEAASLRDLLTPRAHRAQADAHGWPSWPLPVFALPALPSAAAIARVLLPDRVSLKNSFTNQRLRNVVKG